MRPTEHDSNTDVPDDAPGLIAAADALGTVTGLPAHLPALMTVEEGAQALRIGKTKMFELLRNGTLPSVLLGRRRLLHGSEVRRYVESLGAQERDS
jgi:excisionase family DNA binding protein